MNAREQALRNTIAQRAGVDRDGFEVRIQPTGDDETFQLLVYNNSLDDEAMKRIDSTIGQTMRAPLRIRLRRLFLPPFPFYGALIIFVVDALVFRTWLALIWLVLAWVFMPKKCDDCGRYHR